MNQIIKVECLKHIYPDKTQVNICGLHFVVNKGERVVILGPNGTGKTTLLFHILGLLKPIEGEVSVFGLNPVRNFNELRKRIGVVFQNVDEQIIGPTVFDDIAFSLINEGYNREHIKETVEKIASKIGILELLNKIPHYLSGGEKKKVALAGAMVMSPELLVLDEPFNGLDPKSKEEMTILLNSLNKDFGTTLILTTHSINIVPEIADTVYVINKGSIMLKGSPKEVFVKTDILKEANLRPPILVELFKRINKRGFELDIPINVDEAEEQLLKMLKK